MKKRKGIMPLKFVLEIEISDTGGIKFRDNKGIDDFDCIRYVCDRMDNTIIYYPVGFRKPGGKYKVIASYDAKQPIEDIKKIVYNHYHENQI